MELDCWGSNTGLATSWLCGLSGHICGMVRITLVDADQALRTVPPYSKDRLSKCKCFSWV